MLAVPLVFQPRASPDMHKELEEIRAQLSTHEPKEPAPAPAVHGCRRAPVSPFLCPGGSDLEKLIIYIQRKEVRFTATCGFFFLIYFFNIFLRSIRKPRLGLLINHKMKRVSRVSALAVQLVGQTGLLVTSTGGFLPRVSRAGCCVGPPAGSSMSIGTHRRSQAGGKPTVAHQPHPFLARFASCLSKPQEKPVQKSQSRHEGRRGLLRTAGWFPPDRLVG